MTVLFDHLSLGVNDLARSKRFYDAALAPLGIVGQLTVEGEIGYAFAGTPPAAPTAQAFFIGFENPNARRPVFAKIEALRQQNHELRARIGRAGRARRKNCVWFFCMR